MDESRYCTNSAASRVEEVDVDYYLNNILNDLLFESFSAEVETGERNALSYKRKFDDIDDNVDMETQQTMSVSIPRDIRSTSTLYHFVSEAINQSAVSIYSSVVEKIIHPESTITFICPGLKIERQGSVGPVLMRASMKTFSGMSAIVTRTRAFRSSTGVKTISYCRVRGTNINTKYINQFFGQDDNALLTDYFVDDKKTPQKDIINMKATECMAKDYNRKFEVFIKLVGIDEYDPSVQFIQRQWLWIRASSIRLANNT